jgi:hypothetical protein
VRWAVARARGLACPIRSSRISVARRCPPPPARVTSSGNSYYPYARRCSAARTCGAAGEPYSATHRVRAYLPSWLDAQRAASPHLSGVSVREPRPTWGARQGRQIPAEPVAMPCELAEGVEHDCIGGGAIISLRRRLLGAGVLDAPASRSPVRIQREAGARSSQEGKRRARGTRCSSWRHREQVKEEPAAHDGHGRQTGERA